jgi:hypothetical protein
MQSRALPEAAQHHERSENYISQSRKRQAQTKVPMNLTGNAGDTSKKLRSCIEKYGPEQRQTPPYPHEQSSFLRLCLQLPVLELGAGLRLRD